MHTPRSPDPRTCTLVELLKARADETPDRAAYVFLRDGERDEVRLTYAELDRRARAVAAGLLARGAPGDRALLLCSPGLDYLFALFGCLYAGIIATPAYPPERGRGLARLRAIIEDCSPTAALITADISALAGPLTELLGTADLLIVEALAGGAALPRLTGDRIALLQYTSGSTGDPRGVMLSHENLLQNQRLIEVGCGHDEQTVFVTWLPLYHDMGLIGNVLQALYLGVRCVIMTPAHFAERPARWLEAISRYRGTTSGGPNSAYAYCTRKVTPRERALLDLRSWKVAFNGAEPIHAETLDRFAATFGEHGFRSEAFYPCYGLAEASLIVTGNDVAARPVVRRFRAAALQRSRAEEASFGEAGSRALVGSGVALLDTEIAIVDCDTRVRCGPEEIGEIWIAGGSVGKGYWNRPEETERTFGARAADGSGPFLRTGDLGFLHEGELFVHGRLKDIIILRGKNHCPQDIERTVERCHDALVPGGAAAFAIEAEGEERLALVHEVRLRRDETALDLDAVVAAVRDAVAREHGIQVHEVVLVRHGTIPKTSSGKIRRRACRDGLSVGELAVLKRSALALGDGAPPDGLGAPLAVEPGEQPAALLGWLKTQAALALGAGAPAALDPELPLTAAGLDSLTSMALAHTIERELGVRVSIVRLLEDNLRSIAATLANQGAALRADRAKDAGETPDRELPSGGEQPLSCVQQALSFLQQVSPASAAYNLARAFEITSPVDTAALRRACRALVDRHPTLHTTLHGDLSRPVEGELDFREVDASAWDDGALDAALLDDSHRPFELELGPPCRFRVYRRADERWTLLFVAHHAVMDLWSLSIAIRDIAALYAREAAGAADRLPPVQASYADFAAAERRMLAGTEGERHLRYWSERLSRPTRSLGLSAARARPGAAPPSELGALHAFTIDERSAERLERLAKALQTTLNVVLVAAFGVLLHRTTGEDDVTLGAPAANRGSASFAETVGSFVNPVVLRIDLSRDPSFIELVSQVRQTVNDALEHQEYPFSQLVARLRPVRDEATAPFFDVMFAYQRTPLSDDAFGALALGVDGPPMQLGGMRARPRAVPVRASALPLSLSFARTGRALGATFEYRTALFEADAIARMARRLKRLLEGVADGPGERIGALPLLCEDDEAALSQPAPREQACWPARGAECLHEVFRTVAERTPDAIAVVAGSDDVTYGELRRRVQRAARLLRARGVGRGSVVAVLLDRSVELIVTLLGVLEVGAAYLALDPAHPPERLRLLMADAGAALLVARQPLKERLGPAPLPVPSVEPGDEPPPGAMADGPSASPEDRAYVIFTSGSTGRPKCVEIEHRSLVDVLRALGAFLGFTARDRILSATSVSFDLSVLEIFLPLVTGATAVLARGAWASEPRDIARTIEEHRVTVAQATPSAWQMLVDAGWPGARGLTMISGGEALPPRLALELLERGDALYNLYGPTEATIYAAGCRIRRETIDLDATSVPIGTGIPGATLHVLDRYASPAPIGVIGEIYLGGAGVARGYMGSPGMTADRFRPDPHGAPGGRLYRTGDRGQRRADGGVDFLGRVDHQLKIRGVRVEPAEIEAALREHPGVRAAAVVGRAGRQGDVQIVAYVVAPEAVREPLQASLRRMLPGAYLPSTYVFVDALPLTAAGKVDRAALPCPEQQRPAAATPGTAGEQVIAAIWRDVLGVERVGIDDNFFDAGGHSLLLGRVRVALEQAYARPIPMSVLFRCTTVRRLADHLASGASVDVDDVDNGGGEAEQQAAMGKARLRQRLGRVRRAAK